MSDWTQPSRGGGGGHNSSRTKARRTQPFVDPHSCSKASPMRQRTGRRIRTRPVQKPTGGCRRRSRTKATRCRRAGCTIFCSIRIRFGRRRSCGCRDSTCRAAKRRRWRIILPRSATRSFRMRMPAAAIGDGWRQRSATTPRGVRSQGPGVSDQGTGIRGQRSHRGRRTGCSGWMMP